MDHQEKIFQFMGASDFYPHPVSKIEQRESATIIVIRKQP
jgi:hypothetical protein